MALAAEHPRRVRPRSILAPNAAPVDAQDSRGPCYGPLLTPPQVGGGEKDQHATWTELFFDLVVVAGVGQIAHVLHGAPSLADLALYTVLYCAFWIAWTGFTAYGNIRAEQARTSTILLGMLGMAVLAASVPGIRGTHATAFIITYVLLRWLAGRIWQRGTVVMDWPLAQLGGSTVLWIASLWTDPPLRYWLWALSIVLDFTALFAVSGQRLITRTLERVDKITKHRGTPPEAPARPDRLWPGSHLTERLGLSAIIVVGEGIIQAISATAEMTWKPAVIATALGSLTRLMPRSNSVHSHFTSRAPEQSTRLGQPMFPQVRDVLTCGNDERSNCVSAGQRHPYRS
ncbi:low temperature requirement protein A [Kitasatospora azatica]|uniref:low temperature requirement protein A n=1 Tax=Kitasatospora azatica TaxID=58347 RepID=UPI0007C63795|nr:low temperature requirement protein A [Kitasatospora azatica]